jgi:hypothetical protein
MLRRFRYRVRFFRHFLRPVRHTGLSTSSNSIVHGRSGLTRALFVRFIINTAITEYINRTLVRHVPFAVAYVYYFCPRRNAFARPLPPHKKSGPVSPLLPRHPAGYVYQGGTGRHNLCASGP